MLSLCEPPSRSSPSSLVCGAPAELEKLDWRLRPRSLERNVRRIQNTLQTSHTETVITPQYSGAQIHYTLQTKPSPGHGHPWIPTG